MFENVLWALVSYLGHHPAFYHLSYETSYFNTYTTLLVLLSLLFTPTHSAESSKRRRDVVRQKIAEYLQHAEELYQTYLLHKEGEGGGGGGELAATVCLHFRLNSILSDRFCVHVCS